MPDSRQRGVNKKPPSEDKAIGQGQKDYLLGVQNGTGADT